METPNKSSETNWHHGQLKLGANESTKGHDPSTLKKRIWGKGGNLKRGEKGLGHCRQDLVLVQEGK